MATLILTVLGDDRPGLVSALSAPVKAHGASWERSQMSRLAGKFAGIVVVSVANHRVDPLVAELTALSSQGLQVSLERSDQPGERASLRFNLELLGADRPGIVAEISASLAAQQVSIEELTTDVHEAPMSGGMIFEAKALLDAPLTTRSEDLRAMLEGLADELMVEIRLSDD